MPYLFSNFQKFTHFNIFRISRFKTHDVFYNFWTFTLYNILLLSNFQTFRNSFLNHSELHTLTIIIVLKNTNLNIKHLILRQSHFMKPTIPPIQFSDLFTLKDALPLFPVFINSHFTVHHLFSNFQIFTLQDPLSLLIFGLSHSKTFINITLFQFTDFHN